MVHAPHTLTQRTIERVRVALETPALRAFDRAVPKARTTFVMPKKNSERRRELLSGALLLTESMAPALYSHARTALSNLAIDDSIEIYQQDGPLPNAHAVLPGAPIGIKFTGDFAARLSEGELVALFGHEVGHCVAHAQNPEFSWARAAGTQFRKEARVFLLASEMTADRFALLASQSLGAALRLIMRSVAGKSSHVALDAKAYLTQARALAEDALASKKAMLGDTHPEHYLRSYATWLFWESDLYAELTGKGPGKKKIAEIDTTLSRLLGLHGHPAAQSAAAPTRAAIPNVGQPSVHSTPITNTREKPGNRATRVRTIGRR